MMAVTNMMIGQYDASCKASQVSGTQIPGSFGGEADLWSSEVRWYETQPTADWNKDGFLLALDKMAVLTSQTTLLDVGCGAGVYTAAVAKRVNRVVGVDLSPAMLAASRERACRDGIENLTLIEADWHMFDIERLGWRAAFDVVMARMTPAVSRDADFLKMLDCGRKYGVYECFVNRRHRWMVRARAVAGLAGPVWNEHRADEIEALLRSRGIASKQSRREDVWGEPRRRWQRVADFCVSRLMLHDGISEETALAIRRDFEASADADGMLDAREPLTIVTFHWAYD